MKAIFKFIFVLVLFYACTPDHKLLLMNNTNRIIVYYDTDGLKNDTFPNIEDCDRSILYDIVPCQEKLMVRGLLWERYFEKHPNNSVHIYVTYEDTLQKYGTCNVLKNRIFEKTYNITFEDAKRMNWRIVFDGK